MDVLITGGAGFIGSHLADLYVQRGDTVMVIDDLSTGDLQNIAHLRSYPNFLFHPGRVEDTEILHPLADRANLVLHMAAAVGVRLVVENSVKAIDTNLEATMAVLRAASRTKTPVFFASSSEVYGKSDAVPSVEDDHFDIGMPSVGRWSYACSKAMGEFLGMAHWKEFGTPVVIGRLFNTSGPRQKGTYGMVLPRLVQQALTGSPLTIFGDGHQSRCFSHVTDVTGAIVQLMDTPAAYGQILNIGTDQETTILGLAERVRTLTDSSSQLMHIPYQQAYGTNFEETFRRIPKLEKIRTLIGYTPRLGLDDIITSVVEFTNGSRRRVA